MFSEVEEMDADIMEEVLVKSEPDLSNSGKSQRPILKDYFYFNK